MASSSTPSDSDLRVSNTAYPLNSAAAAAAGPRPHDVEGFVSDLRAQDKVDELLAKHGVPNQYTARLAGDLRANSKPPEGFICVYEAALEGGMRIPLHRFYCQVLNHFGIAPSQLTPNSWRIMAGFLVICHEADVLASLAVFRRFFSFLPLVADQKHKAGWYYFRSKKSMRFTGIANNNKDWKYTFFFLSSPMPWRCPVEWGEPLKSAVTEPTLTSEEENAAVMLLRAYGAAPVDFDVYFSEKNLIAAKISIVSPPSDRAPSSARTTIQSIEMDPSVLDMMYAEMEDEEAAQASELVKKGKTVPAKKRRLNEANNKEVEGLHSTVVLNTPPAAVGSSSRAGMCSAPPLHFSNNNIDWKAAQKVLQGLTASQEHVFAGKEPSDVVASGFVAMLEALNYVTFSLGYAVDADKKLESAELDNAASREELEKTKAELVESKRVAEADREKAKAELAVWKRAAEEDRDKAKAELATVKRSAEEELQKVKAQLAAAKEELESSKAAEQRLRSEVRMLRRAERALEVTQQGGLHSARGASETKPPQVVLIDD